MDEAVVYFGITLENMLDEASSGKASKEERKARAKREALIDKIFGDEDKPGSGYADPALMF